MTIDEYFTAERRANLETLIRDAISGDPIATIYWEKIKHYLQTKHGADL